MHHHPEPFFRRRGSNQLHTSEQSCPLTYNLALIVFVRPHLIHELGNAKPAVAKVEELGRGRVPPYGRLEAFLPVMLHCHRGSVFTPGGCGDGGTEVRPRTQVVPVAVVLVLVVAGPGDAQPEIEVGDVLGRTEEGHLTVAGGMPHPLAPHRVKQVGAAERGGTRPTRI